MNKSFIKSNVIFLAIFMLVSVTILLKLSIDYEQKKAKDKEVKMSGLDLMEFHTKKVEEDSEELDYRMKITLPEGIKEADITLKEDYVQQLITVTIPGIGEEFFYKYPILGNSSHIDNLKFGKGVIEITMDEVYEMQHEVEGAYLILNYFKPRELYDKVIVIDAGHGGSAPGAVKQGVLEKELNLAITLELKELLDELEKKEKIRVYYTRTDDTNPSLDQRVNLANKSHANMFISIHNNSTTDGTMSSYNGTEVMYDEHKKNEEMGTRFLSEIILKETVKQTGSRDDGLVDGHWIKIVRSSEVPVALVEVGFMTNMNELEKLKTKDYQRKAAKGIYNGILRAIEEGY